MSAEWLHTSTRLTADGWRHGWSGPGGPDFKSPADAARHGVAVDRLTDAVGLSGAAWATQVHGPQVTYVDVGGWCGEADALWTDVPGLGVVGRSADCPLILVGGRRSDGSRLAGFAHASWRSTVQRITTGLIEALAGGGAERATLTAVICPSAGPCCYEVGPEVRAAAREALGPSADGFFRPVGDRHHFDLWAANLAQLTAGGVSPDRVLATGVCTICHPAHWPSYRRDGDRAGRFAAVISA